jgi:general secretion pathway protein M
MRTLTPRERRVLALGILVLVLALGWFGVVQPLIGGFLSRADERRELQATLQRDDRLMASLPAWRAAAARQAAAADRFSIAAPSEPLAVEALKDRLRKLAADEGYDVPSIEDLQSDATPGAIKVRADIELNMTQLYDTVRQLQSEGAYVVVDYLSVSADRALAAGRLQPMAVRLELTAAWRPPRGRPS